jgi:ATP-binding cassette subfamily B protein
MRVLNEKIDFRHNLKIYFELLKRHKLIFIFLIFLILIIEASDIVVPYLFKIITDNAAGFIAGTLMRNAFVEILLNVLFAYLILLVIKSISEWLHIHFLNILDSNLMMDLKRRFFNHLIHLHYGFHTSHKTGSLISKLLRGSGSMERFTDVIAFNVAPLMFSFIVTGASIFYFDAFSALIVALVVIIFIGYSLFMQNLQKDANVRANENEDYEKGIISDFFTNIDSIKFFGKEFNIKNKYKKLSEITRISRLKHWGFFRWMSGGQALILGIGTLALVYFPMTKFLDNELSIGTLVFIYTAFGNLVGLLFRFIHGIRGFYTSMADFHSLFKYEKIHNEIKDIQDAKEIDIKKGEIEFKNLTFGYKKNKLFSNFNLKIPKNKKVALVGHSGSGKTTLVRLLYRLYDVDGGKILIDGKDIKNVKQESLRSELSIVPQECVLFDESIYNNIAFSNPKAKREDVIKAMKFAQLLNVVSTFPKKEKTIVGERGVKLSGGEKQRVSLARAILADKKILVLDEPTSSLDSKTEYEIQKGMDELMKDRTSIIIAHRLSTIMNSDMIIVMDKGKIVQKGTHKELIRKKGVYKELWDLQKGGYIR